MEVFFANLWSDAHRVDSDLKYKFILISVSRRFHAPDFLWNRTLEFSDFLFWKIRKKWVRRWRFHFFTKSSKMAPFWPIWAQNAQRGFSHFFRKPHIGISYFFARCLVAGAEKNHGLVFYQKFKNDPFGQNWPKFGLSLVIIRPEARVSKKLLWVKNPHFALMNTSMPPLSQYLEKFWNS